VNNFWNVASNLPFLVVGLWGLYYVHRYGESTCLPGLQPAYGVFFTGICLTAFGSGYYHLIPANDSLVWDRLPMTIGFAGLFSIIIGEFVSVRGGRRLLAPLLVIGIASVVYDDVNSNYPVDAQTVDWCGPVLLADDALLRTRQAVRTFRRGDLRCGNVNQRTHAQACVCLHGSSDDALCIGGASPCPREFDW